jgi:hypothetical protein
VHTPSDPAKHLLIVHQGFLPKAAWHMQQVQLRCVREDAIRRQSQAGDVFHWFDRLAENAVGRVRDARQDFERSCEIDLIQVLEQQGADLEVDATPRLHVASFVKQLKPLPKVLSSITFHIASSH